VRLVSSSCGMFLNVRVLASRTVLTEPSVDFFQEIFYSCECS